uniref:Trichome birefringence-like C-terminal domain-containing protein n=1 Tax=Oryza punctata TaxID=4537 RepID=A0A0E0K645_ORYPU
MARNQAESLVCLLTTVFPYTLVYRDPNPQDRKFWRWAFPVHNVTVSLYWAPFLARSTGKMDDYRRTLERLVGFGTGNRTLTVVVAMFSPSHFEKAWDDPTMCAMTRPYKEGEKEVGGNKRELRSIAMEEAWDDPTMCAMTRPYKEGEKEVGGNKRELRSIAMEEMQPSLWVGVILNSQADYNN